MRWKSIHRRDSLRSSQVSRSATFPAAAHYRLFDNTNATAAPQTRQSDAIVTLLSESAQPFSFARIRAWYNRKNTDGTVAAHELLNIW